MKEREKLKSIIGKAGGSEELSCTLKVETHLASVHQHRHADWRENRGTEETQHNQTANTRILRFGKFSYNML